MSLLFTPAKLGTLALPNRLSAQLRLNGWPMKTAVRARN